MQLRLVLCALSIVTASSAVSARVAIDRVGRSDETALADEPPPKEKPPVTLTAKAAAQVKAIAKEQEYAGPWWLRVGVKMSDDGARFSYLLDLTEDKPGANDIVHQVEGIAVVVDDKSALYLEGTTIDFRDSDKGRGFVFNNPNAKADEKKE